MARTTDPSPADPAPGNRDKLRTLFPEAFPGGELDFAVLRRLLGAEPRAEPFGLHWHGKRKARQEALAATTARLQPCPAESVDWERTGNLLIEGDNLEALKLLQEDHAGKVDLIYIDPPYNTGKDFSYPDNFHDPLHRYLKRTQQPRNGEEAGRFHTAWLNMLMPRLILARDLMAEDGLIFISISDKELHNLRHLGDEVFGERNFVECYVWNSIFRPDNSSRICRRNAEFVLCYARRIERIGDLVGELIDRTGLPSLTKASMARSVLAFPAGAVHFTLADGDYARGPRRSYDLLDDVAVRGGRNRDPFRLRGRVIWGQANLLEELAAGTRIVIKTDGFVPYVDKGAQGVLRPAKLIPKEAVGDVLAANAEIRELFGENVFDYPKPTSLVRHFIGFRKSHRLILDFFAGSGTTAHAVLAANAEDGGCRRFILVQLPEPLDPAKADQAQAAACCARLGLPLRLCELTKERIRRAGQAIRAAEPDSSGDLGFRVLKVVAAGPSA